MEERKMKEERKPMIDVKIIGIKCDFCDWNDMSVPMEEYESYIGMPCPKCGHNLLTVSDYKRCMRIVRLTKFLGKILPKSRADTPESRITMPFPHKEDQP